MSETQTTPEEVKSLKKLDDLYSLFKEDFPSEAYSSDMSRGFALTSLKAQYIIERLNETVGFNNWRLDGDYKEIEDKETGDFQGVLFQGKLVLFLTEYYKDGDANNVHQVPTVGYHEAFTVDKKSGNKKYKLYGDVYKSARTDALSKAASYLGIGNDMFKGKVSTTGEVKTSKSSPTKKPSSFQGKKPSKKASDF